ncbi:hypothetical protein DH2020_029391 [Rehmannia glutinosa]|uniref:Uncharacterized protein n=1 Tax=Rehmannia glutinosa TaxID=99300 RepID=A0ABR0VNR8_REHGL
MSSGGRFYWVRNRGGEFKAKGIIVVFAWVSISDDQLKDFIGLYSSLGWNSLVCRSDYLNPFIPERATSLAFSVLGELVEELRCGLCPVVFASFSGGSKACMYKVLQIIEGCSDVELSLEDSRLVASCISGQIYDSDPIEFTTDLGARFALHRSILKMPGSSKLVSLFAKGVTSAFTGYGGNVKVVKWNTSTHIGHHKHRSKQCTAAVTELLEQAISIFTEKIQKLGEKFCIDDMHDEISLICDLQNAAVDSNQSFRRVAVGPNDHFFLPSSSEHANSREIGSIQQERKERRGHSLVGLSIDQDYKSLMFRFIMYVQNVRETKLEIWLLKS